MMISKILLLIWLLSRPMGNVDSFHLSGIRSPNPQEKIGLFEGDIVTTWLAGRSGIINPAARWPRGVIPYRFQFGSPQVLKDMAHNAMQHITNQTSSCITFVEHTDEVDFVYIAYTTDGCYSEVGRSGGMQIVSLPEPCLDIGIHIHEFIHVIGYFHEQSRSDRDRFVRIHLENVIPGMEYNFDKYSSDEVSGYDVPYDYDSIMHYGAKAFSVNGKDTIVPIPDLIFLDEKEQMSHGDAQKVKNMYACE